MKFSFLRRAAQFPGPGSRAGASGGAAAEQEGRAAAVAVREALRSSGVGLKPAVKAWSTRGADSCPPTTVGPGPCCCHALKTRIPVDPLGNYLELAVAAAPSRRPSGQNLYPSTHVQLIRILSPFLIFFLPLLLKCIRYAN